MTLLPKLIVVSALVLTPFIQAADSSALQQALNNPVRSDANKARDIYRHPAETLSFFEVTPKSTVVEISPGSGWYTEILAPLLSAEGKYYAAHHPANSTSDYSKRTLAAFKEKLASNDVYKNVVLTEFSPVPGQQVAPAGSADVVLTFRNLHNWYMQKGEQGMVDAFKSFYDALKPGGVLGVVEHRLPEAKKGDDWLKSGYFPQSLAIELAEKAGFKLEASSEINANPKDTADHPGGVWTLPPTLSQKEQDKDKYLAIGESDRMTLKFRKPATH
ncbi:methyltransferase [Rheinheimera sp.]|uniref:class I SAM-dependent methyltransferase n=1 Tax=Rheinheimera sp. TaxID=1869214 RepID=UPI00307D9C83